MLILGKVLFLCPYLKTNTVLNQLGCLNMIIPRLVIILLPFARKIGKIYLVK